jgi:ATP-dependent RNA helicase RhlB
MTATIVPAMRYDELDLHPDLARAIQEAGYVDCMPVQAATFPIAFTGRDIYAQSQTGTGKTAAFLISILQRMMTNPELRERKTLIIAPTRELAFQIEGEARKLAKYLPISMGCFFGGMAYGPQETMLRDDVQMIIGTPGRIIDLVMQGKMVLRTVGFLVVDEADRMFDMGFIDDLRKLLRYLPPPTNRQTFLYSATLSFRIKNLAWEYMHDPLEIAIEPETVTVELVTQELYHVGSDEKLPMVLGLLAREKPHSALIFCNQKFVAEEIARRLGINDIECEYIMGDLPQSKRLQVIERLKAGKIAVLVATDVAARGLDVTGLDLVINYDLPMDAESYVHRIGRTARAGAAGKAVSLACEKFVYGLPAIEKYLGIKIPVCNVTQELLLEDKSRNLRFGGHSHNRSMGGERRDHGREHSRDRDRPSGYGAGASSGSRRPAGPGRSAPAERRPASPGYAGNSGGQRSRPQGPAPRAEPRPAESGHQPAGGNQGNPYAMSSNERMKLYKDKYASGQGQGGAQSGRSGGRPEGQNDNGGQRRPRQGERDRRPADGERQTGSGQSQARRPDSQRSDGQRSDAQRGNGSRRDGTQRSDGQRSDGQRGNQGQNNQRRERRPDQARPAGQNAKPAGTSREPAKKPGLLGFIKNLFGKKKDK